MKDLKSFQTPNDNETTVCEVDGKLHSMSYSYANIAVFTSTTLNHPEVIITRDILQANYADEKQGLFIPVAEPFLKRLIQIYSEQGFEEVLRFTSEQGPVVARIGASFVLSLINAYNTVESTLTNKTVVDARSLIENCSLSRLWSTSLIRCIAWHSYKTKIAVATLDDCVRIYGGVIVPQLRNKQQRNISCIAWRPLSISEIAIGCENGIFIWDVDPNSVATRFSISNAVILHRINHKPIVSLAWSWRGDLLASAAGCDSSVLIWNVEFDDTSSLKRPGGGGNSLIKWSPDGSRLFSSTTGIAFRVWECCTWQSERWTLLSGRVQSACWSPCGSTILFTTTEEPIIYALSFIRGELLFTSDSKDSANQAIPVYDVSKVEIGNLIVGGIIQNMELDSKGYNLVVLFKETDYLAMFKVTFHPILQLIPNGLIVGKSGEKPVAVDFQKNFEHGSCLSIAWSSGRIQHFPIVYMETPVKSVVKNFKDSSFYTSFTDHSVL